MENYRKGKNVEEPLTKENVPIPNLPENFLWMHVNGGTKIHSVLKRALEDFPRHRAVVWSGSGPAVKKTISCVEIMKYEHNNTLHQINKICYRVFDEFWEPLIDGLDQIVVKRRVPMIHVLLSLDLLDANELGYQAPGLTIPFKKEIDEQNKNANTSKEHGGIANRSGSKRKSIPFKCPKNLI